MTFYHQAHILRPRLNEWCGGTEPPSIVTVDKVNAELAVDVFPTGSNLHTGNILSSISTEQFLIPPNFKQNPESIGGYALRAVEATAKRHIKSI